MNKNEVITGREEESQELSREDILIEVLQLQKRTNENVRTLRKDVDDIKKNTPIHPSLNNLLTKLRRRRVVSMLGGKESKAYTHVYPEGSSYKRLSNKVFAEAGRDFNSHFGLSTYAELPQPKYEEAKEYWENWEPSHNTKLEIKRINDQLELLPRQVKE